MTPIYPGSASATSQPFVGTRAYPGPTTPARQQPRAGNVTRLCRKRDALAHACERGRARGAAALLEVLLVVVLRLVERLGRLDLRHDRRCVARLLARLRCECRFLLLLVVKEHDRAVLVADVPTLPVELRRIVLAPEHLQQLVVGHALRVVRHFDDLRVAGRMRAHVFVRRILERAAAVADTRARDAVELAERRLDAPEAAGAERCLLLHYSSSSLSAAELMQYRSPVGRGPSGNTWPRCPPQF